MHTQALRSVAAAAVVIAALPAAAAEAPESCELPASEVDPLADRGLLDFSEAAACSFGYEALLRQGFGGNFHALMAWWHSQRGEPLP